VGSRSPLEGAGISNIEYRLHEFRSDGSPLLEHNERKDIQPLDEFFSKKSRSFCSKTLHPENPV
jgi:hypothetical protein